MRWRSSYQLVNTKGELKKAYLHSVGKKARYDKEFIDRKTKNTFTLKLLYSTVTLPDSPENSLTEKNPAEKKLTLLVCRRKRKGQPWYLLTDQAIDNEQQAWDLVAAYQRRWQIEEAFRFNKSELAMESPRLWFWENRLKLMMIMGADDGCSGAWISLIDSQIRYSTTIIALGLSSNRKAVQTYICTAISNPNGLSVSFSAFVYS